jgi:hypothetical protein
LIFPSNLAGAIASLSSKPGDKYREEGIEKAYLEPFSRIDFVADLRGIPATACNLICRRDDFTPYLWRGGHRNLSRAISWLNFLRA